MNKVERLWKIKQSISSEDIMNSVAISKDFLKKSLVLQVELLEQQRAKQRELVPSLELYKTEFTL